MLAPVRLPGSRVRRVWDAQLISRRPCTGWRAAETEGVGSVVPTERGVPGAGHEGTELGAADPDQAAVVAPLEAHLGCRGQALVEDHLEAVGVA